MRPALAIVCLVAIAALLLGCDEDRSLYLHRWTLSPGDVRVTLPAHIEDAMPEATTRFTLRAEVELPEDLRVRPLTFAVPRLLALAQLRVNGRPAAPLDTPLDEPVRSAGPQRWRVDPAGERTLTLELDLHTPLTIEKWLDTVPRLSATPEGDRGFLFVRTFNETTSVASSAMSFLAGLPYLLIYLLDRRRVVFMWHGVEAILAASYGLLTLGLTQLAFADREGPVVGLLITLAAVCGLHFTYAYFDLGRVPRWTNVVWIVPTLGLFTFRPLASMLWTIIPVAVGLGGCIGYQLVVLGRLAFRRASPKNARLLFAAWLLLGAAGSTEYFAWFGLGEPLAGLRAGPLGIAIIAFLHVAVLSTDHNTLLRDAERLNDELASRVDELQGTNREVQLLNDELRRQITARSRQLEETFAQGRSTGGGAAPPLTDGQVVERRYSVVRTLGSGGMGTVYEVERLRDRRRFALKMLSKRTGATAMARFAREANLASQIDHPNVVSIVDVDVTQAGQPFLVMELVSGSALDEQRARYGDVPWALGVLLQVAAGLGAVHARGIIHRDLKAANVLLTAPGATGQTPPEGTVKIADFGVAGIADADEGALADTIAEATPGNDQASPLASTGAPDKTPRLTATGVVLGTPLYMPPELAHGATNATFAADVYSFGVLAFETLTREMPFREAPFLALRYGLSVPPPTPLRDKCAAVTPELAALLDACLRMDPKARPALAELARALRSEHALIVETVGTVAGP